jgi:tartrate dehydrogenase/decarboxylase/D-malate dehydrogenase
MNNSYEIAVIPGDGIGTEIMPVALEVLEKISGLFGFTCSYKFFGYGAGFFKEHGVFMPEDALDELKQFSAILFGAVGLPDVDDRLPAKAFTFKVRTGFRQYVNFRPVRIWPGFARPLRTDKTFDFVVIRENNEGEFVQAGKQIMPDTESGIGIDTSVFTRKGVERIAHYAFQLAQKRNRFVTTVTKSNTLIHSLSFWDRVIREVAVQYPDVDHQYMYIDATSANFVLRPWIFDVVLTTNLFGDILSDLGGALMGSLGLGGSGNINPEKQYPSMFEPIHGSAPDIAGKNQANPVGMIWSVSMMLDHLGEKRAGQSIIRAVDRVFKDGNLPVDLGGNIRTDEFSNLVIAKLSE